MNVSPTVAPTALSQRKRSPGDTYLRMLEHIRHPHQWDRNLADNLKSMYDTLRNRSRLKSG